MWSSLVLAGPFGEAAPLRCVCVEPISDWSLLADNLEDELKDGLHPLEVAQVLLHGVHESFQPNRSLANEVGVLGLEQHLKQAEERPDLVVVVLLQSRLHRSE